MKVNRLLEVIARTWVNECFEIKLCGCATSVCAHTATSDLYFEFLLTTLVKASQRKEMLNILQKFKL